MKRCTCIFLIFYIIVNSIMVYGNDVSMIKKISQPLNIEELTTKIGVNKYDITVNGKNIEKTIEMYEYSNKVGDFISLREIIEALGGVIEWNPNDDTKELGYFELLGRRYYYESGISIDNLDIDLETYFPINLYTYMDDNKVLLTMSSSLESMSSRLIGDRIYINITALRRLLPRMGYLVNINGEEKTLNIKEYDFNYERELVLRKFPIKKFGKSYYGDEYEEYTLLYSDEYFCFDFFCEQVGATETIEQNYYDYVNSEFRQLFVIKFDNIKFYKDMLQVAHGNYIDDEIYVDYDEELDAYIIYNKDFTKVDYIDDSYKILVLRRYDNMVLYFH